MAGGGGAQKVDEFQPHPIKDQLPGVDFCVTSSPPWPEAILLGFQHFLVMLGTTVIIPTILVPLMGGGDVEKAEVIETLLFVAGINTLLQTVFGTRLPVVMGRFKQSMRAIQGAVIVASFFQMILGFLGFVRIFGRFLSPLSAVPLVTLTGLGFFVFGFPQLANCVEVGLPALIILVFLSQYTMKLKLPIFHRFAVLFSVAIVWVYAEILTAAGAYDKRSPITQRSCRTDRSGLVSSARWIRVPYPFQWGRPDFNAGDAFSMMAAAFVAIVESTGTFIAASRYGSATPLPPSVLSRGIGWQGINTFLDGIFGTLTGSTASVSFGINAYWKSESNSNIGRLYALLLCIRFSVSLIMSFTGKFGAVLASIPLPIVAALYCVLYAYVASAGLGLLQFCNLNSYRSKFIVGFALFMGLSVPQYFNEYLATSGHGPVHTGSTWFNNIVQVIFSSPATVAIIIAFFLDLTVSRQHSATRRDSGRHWWAKFRNFDSDTRSEEFYSLPYNLNRHFPSV
ncbi:Xanthine/uracil permease family protein [Prunus dulcis]|uniref:Xanthine/uracil permease family protein n=1 Tax=Prunus dulcis TaxID=3755 RepID=A0A4Y1S0F0_PRUDU|nr:Xanthine/uracil permease family protein [Prunus dulcis]